MGPTSEATRPAPRRGSLRNAIVEATIAAGTLDILSAFGFAGLAGMGPLAVLHFVASGPFGDKALQGGGWAIMGIAVHYAIMACMVTAYAMYARRAPVLVRHPVFAGLGYGVLLWIVMYWIVRPLRWPDMPLPHTAYGIGNALFSHCILVGLPIALIMSRALRGVGAALPSGGQD
ncbi:hypothetical protein [Sphingomonas sp. PR090111-T3T-6A]|uniref:hypothetical protein n=1 Tax=Sphingomonas sp. PR090111-T3T-6A TaxID=685778 RepID=UPI00036473F4|nr:hypothetical protein [Sphingomonas sp. PR090111-T3T-6A]